MPKADGSFRFCTDFRKIHSVTVPDAFPLPRIDDCIDSLGAAKYIAKLVILNCENISQYYCFCCIYDQINTGLLSRRDFFKKSYNLTVQKRLTGSVYTYIFIYLYKWWWATWWARWAFCPSPALIHGEGPFGLGVEEWAVEELALIEPVYLGAPKSTTYCISLP